MASFALYGCLNVCTVGQSAPSTVGLAYMLLVFLPHILLRSFTVAAICGMNRANRCSYPPFPFPTYYPDTGTGSDDFPYANRTFVGPFAQPLLKQTS